MIEPTDNGVNVECFKCGKKATLPYSNSEHTAVSIEPIRNWSMPPMLCPACQPKKL